jgi:hypothetical protein
MLTTAGFTFSARSAKDPGALTLTALAEGISVPDGTKDDFRTSTKETIKKAMRNARRNMMNVLRLLPSLAILPPHAL